MIRHVIYIFLIAAIVFSSCNHSHSNPTSLADVEKMEATILDNILIVKRYQSALETMLTREPSPEETAAIYFKLGKLNEVYGHYEKAIEFYQTLVSHYPQYPEATQSLFNMAEIYRVHLHNSTLALETYDQFTVFFPASEQAFQAHVHAGQIAISKSKWERAIHSLQQAIDHSPDHELCDDVLIQIADIQETRLSQEADAQYEKLIAQYPHSEWRSFAESMLAK